MTDSEHSHEYTPYMYQQHYLTQLMVFGPERMLEIQENEASKESTLEFINAITAVCAEPSATEQHGRKFRQFHPQPDDRSSEVVVMTNPEQVTGLGSNVAEAGIVSMQDYKRGEAPRPKGYPRRLHYVFSESIFVDTGGRAHVHRSVWARESNVGVVSSFKPATESEVQEALDILVSLLNS